MKEVLYFYLPDCPYCRQANAWIEELQKENPALGALTIRRVDERREKEFADSFDYYYVPTLYVDGVKKHEGAATKEKLRAALEAAL